MLLTLEPRLLLEPGPAMFDVIEDTPSLDQVSLEEIMHGASDALNLGNVTT